MTFETLKPYCSKHLQLWIAQFVGLVYDSITNSAWLHIQNFCNITAPAAIKLTYFANMSITPKQKITMFNSGFALVPYIGILASCYVLIICQSSSVGASVTSLYSGRQPTSSQSIRGYCGPANLISGNHLYCNYIMTSSGGQEASPTAKVTEYVS